MAAKPKQKRIPPNAEVEVIEDVFIRMRDGCRLAARIWLPRDAAKNPCPAILEYLPYRKRDGTAPRDDVTHAFWASRGYACARVDLRGCGDSDGLMRDEYTARELADGVEAIAWLASRPWCDGKVGMVGISWGGFNGLQIAALRPPALKAVVAACFTDERYNGDIHYRGGALLGDNFGWSTQMLAYSARPPDPQIVGERWRQMWIARLKHMPLLAANWLEHQWRDDFWRHGSVCEDYGAIEAAVLAIGGWADAYVDSVARLVENMRAPARGIIGPWLHKYPHIAKPRPTIPFPVEALRWWDFWLKGEKNGAMDGPRLRAYMNDSHAPASERDFTPGRWVGVESFARAPLSTFRFDAESRCLRARADGGEAALDSPLTVGADGGAFCPGMRPRDELPTDQRGDDALSLRFDSSPLKKPLDVLGTPLVEIEFAADKPVAQICARLCEVAADGSSNRVSWGVLNLTHRDGDDKPRPLARGRRYVAKIRMRDMGHRFAVGGRIRLALSSAYWPLVWPAPERARLRVFCGAKTALRLPVPRLSSPAARALFAAPAPLPISPTVDLRPPSCARTISRDAASGETTITISTDFGAQRYAHGLTNDGRAEERFSIRPDDPDSARAEIDWTLGVGRGKWQTAIEARAQMRADSDRFFVAAELEATENGQAVHRKRWKKSAPRRLG